MTELTLPSSQLTTAKQPNDLSAYHFNKLEPWTGFDQTVFAQRRQRLLAQLPPDSLLILPTAPVQTRNRDANYPYRADSSFYYLTGFAEPDAVLVLRAGQPDAYWLFCQPRNPEHEQWEGKRLGVEGAKAALGANEAQAIDTLMTQLPELLKQVSTVYLGTGRRPELDQAVMKWLSQAVAGQRSGQKRPEAIYQADTLIDEMRLIKDPDELRAMQQAADISALAHIRAMQTCQVGQFEYELAAELDYTFTRHGGQAAYTHIVGAGQNGVILHYVENRCRIQTNDLILIDAGCELDHYAADITRTFPVNGRFTTAQRAVYDIVLAAQLAAIEAVQVGASWDDFHHAAVEVLTEGLISLGVLTGNREALIASGAYRPYYMHRTGHWLGMDVHDVGRYQQDNETKGRLLQPGMVLTVEPGLYFKPDDETVPSELRGIGIRIEDDLVVTANGPYILTAAAPKTIDEIEALMAAASAMRH